MNTRILKGAMIASTVVAASVGVACNSDRANILDPLGAPSWDFKLSLVNLNFPRGSVVISGVGTSGQLVVTMRGLQALATGSYRMWISDSAMATPVPATADIKVIETDTAFNAQGDAIITVDSTVTLTGSSSFTFGGPRQQVRATINAATMGSDPTLAGPVFFLTAETSTAGTTPAAGAPRPLGAMYPIANGTTSLSFGYFSTDPAQKFVFSGAGFGTGGVRDNIMILDDSTLTRPPLGYYMASYLLWSDSTGLLDTIPLGAQTAPYPRRNVSLYDADANASVDPTVLAAPPRIIAAANRINGDTISKLTTHNAGATGLAKDYRGVQSVFIVLQNKLADPASMSPSKVMEGVMPDLVKKGP